MLTSNGDVINGDPAKPSEIVEFIPSGIYVGQLSVNSAQGAAFGLAVTTTKHRLTLAAVNDGTNTLDLRSMSI